MNIMQRIGPLRMQAIKITAMGAIFWFGWAVACYQSVYLKNIGFQATDLGVLNAIASAVAIASVSFWGMISDKIGSLKKVLFIVLLFGSALYTLVPLIPNGTSYTAVLIFTAIPLINFFKGSMATMVENMQVRNCNELRLNYGLSRATGSFCFALSGFILAGLLAHGLKVSHTFLLSFFLFIPVIVLVLFVREPRGAAKKEKNGKNGATPEEKPDIRLLLRNRQYLAFLVFALLFYTAISCSGGFIPYYMTAIDIPSERYGIVLSYRALLEIPFLLLMNRLRQKFDLKYLLMAAVVLMMVESMLLSTFAYSLPSMLLSTTFFGLGNGLFIGSSLNYLYQLAPAGLKATAQAFFAAASAIAGIGGNLLGGMMFDALGAKPFYLLVFFIYFASVLVFGFSIFLFSRKKNPGSSAA